MGSQPRRGKGRRGRRGKGRGGAGGGGGGVEDERESRERNQIYRKATKNLAAALTAKKFSYAAEIATSVTASRVSAQDVVSLFVAGAKAFKEGKEQDWRPEPTELATDGINFAQQKTGYRLTAPRRRLFSNIIAANLRRVGDRQTRKQP